MGKIIDRVRARERRARDVARAGEIRRMAAAADQVRKRLEARVDVDAVGEKPRVKALPGDRLLRWLGLIP